MKTNLKSTKTRSLYHSKPKLFDDFTEEDETYLDDAIQEMCFVEKVEQLDSDNYL